MMSDRMFGPLNEKYTEYAGVIGDSGRHLLAIINDILDLARADANRLVVTEEEVEISRIVDLSSRIVQELAARAEVIFVTETENCLPNVMGDTAKLTQILVNLLIILDDDSSFDGIDHVFERRAADDTIAQTLDFFTAFNDSTG